MGVITLTTDFGTDDAYVGIMKGVILTINPQAQPVDVTHAIEPQNLARAAFTVNGCHRYFPDGTIHLVVVDPGVGSRRAVIALRIGGHTFVAPDNGILTPLLDAGPIDEMVAVSNPRYFLKPVSRTFHGRDIFAPVGAHLSLGTPLGDFGESMDAARAVRIDLPQPAIDRHGRLAGTVVGSDRFGNLITNIGWSAIRRSLPGADIRSLVFTIAGRRIRGVSPTYEDAGRGRLLVIEGSLDAFEIAVCCGSAARELGAGVGDAVTVAVE